MMRSLLVEIRTEELPPKALARLGRAFGEALRTALERDGLLAENSALRWFATPRRLAAHLSAVRETAPDKPVEIQGPSVKAGRDAQGHATAALQGFARKNGVAVDALEEIDTPKGRVFLYRDVVSGLSLERVLASRVSAALKALPIPKVMRWGAGDAEFVRPVHGLLMLHGERLIAGTVLGLTSANTTLGHRFLSAGAIDVSNADDYERIMLDAGHVVVGFDVRRAAIAKALDEATGAGSTYAADDALLDEVTALTEWPVVYEGRYSPEFLDVPQECLVLSMKQHQKYFPLLDAKSGKLVARFLVVSNLSTPDPASIVHGNERVLRARLSDAKFFYEQDRRERLESRVPQLAQVVYHNRLGSQSQRVERMQLLAGRYARAMDADWILAERAAWLAKADLVTDMVGEFPELQGIMGRYYALHDGEDAAVADAIEAHYRPRFAGDALPDSHVACAVALADKLEALAGFFGIGQQPSGEKDPYALRRQALGVIRILAERALPLELPRLVHDAFEVFDSSYKLEPAQTALLDFLFDRMRAYFGENGYSAKEIDAVLALRPARIDLVPRQLEAVKLFNTLPEAPSLAAANKRIGNILRRAVSAPTTFDAALLAEPAEKALAHSYARARASADECYDAQDYTGVLTTLAALKTPVDAFFDTVMVMSEDPRLRDNRLALLAQLQQTMNRVADISRLAA